MGTKISIPKHTASEAIARGKASATSSGYTAIICAIIFGLVGIGLLIAYSIPQYKSCVLDEECQDGDTCDRSRGHCRKKSRSIGLLIGGLACLMITGILGFLGNLNMTRSRDTAYDRQLGERLIRQQAANAANAPYYAGAAVVESLADGGNRNNYGYRYNYRW